MLIGFSNFVFLIAKNCYRKEEGEIVALDKSPISKFSWKKIFTTIIIASLYILPWKMKSETKRGPRDEKMFFTTQKTLIDVCHVSFSPYVEVN